MIRLEMTQAAIDERRLKNIASSVVNGLFKSGWLQYPTVEAIRELIPTKPQEAVKRICQELEKLVSTPVRKEIRHDS